MAYTTIKKPSDYFNTKLYTGTGSAQSITGVGFQPQMLWIKGRTNAFDHRLADIVRGTPNLLYPNTTDAETADANNISSIDSDGFSLGTGNAVNQSSNTFVSWNWLAGGTGSSNTDGSITSTVSANTTSGFSIVSYTGTGSTATIGHGLGVLPSMIIVKARSNSGQNWITWHKAFTNNNDYVELNTTDAKDNFGLINNTSNTASVFSLTGDGNVNASGGTYIAYCFAEVKGFSKFGSYTGNGNADGTFVYTGFKPAFVITKCTDASPKTWVILDNKRDSFNLMNKKLFTNNSDAEYSGQNACDFLSNGFKLRDNSTNAYSTNHSGGSFIYMAFAEEPLVGDNPATAR